MDLLLESNTLAIQEPRERILAGVLPRDPRGSRLLTSGKIGKIMAACPSEQALRRTTA
jgi:hypothetical protein